MPLKNGMRLVSYRKCKAKTMKLKCKVQKCKLRFLGGSSIEISKYCLKHKFFSDNT